jgi:hypothetical protein
MSRFLVCSFWFLVPTENANLSFDIGSNQQLETRSQKLVYVLS